MKLPILLLILRLTAAAAQSDAQPPAAPDAKVLVCYYTTRGSSPIWPAAARNAPTSGYFAPPTDGSRQEAGFVPLLGDPSVSRGPLPVAEARSLPARVYFSAQNAINGSLGSLFSQRIAASRQVQHAHQQHYAPAPSQRQDIRKMLAASEPQLGPSLSRYLFQQPQGQLQQGALYDLVGGEPASADGIVEAPAAGSVPIMSPMSSISSANVNNNNAPASAAFSHVDGNNGFVMSLAATNRDNGQSYSFIGGGSGASAASVHSHSLGQSPTKSANKYNIDGATNKQQLIFSPQMNGPTFIVGGQSQQQHQHQHQHQHQLKRHQTNNEPPSQQAQAQDSKSHLFIATSSGQQPLQIQSHYNPAATSSAGVPLFSQQRENFPLPSLAMRVTGPPGANSPITDHQPLATFSAVSSTPPVPLSPASSSVGQAQAKAQKQWSYLTSASSSQLLVPAKFIKGDSMMPLETKSDPSSSSSGQLQLAPLPSIHHQPVASSGAATQGASSPASGSGPLAAMFDVFGVASQYLMKLKPSSLIAPASFVFNTISSDASHKSSLSLAPPSSIINPAVGGSGVQAKGQGSMSNASSSLLLNSMTSGGSLLPLGFSSGLMASLSKSSPSSSVTSQVSANNRSGSSAVSVMSRLALQQGGQRREDVCGKTIQSPQRRIIGGEGARYGEFPYQVHIKIAKHQCGGALVDKQSIVTAAHCVYHFITRAPVSKLQIVIGAYDIEDERYQELPPQYFKVNKVKLHPNFRFSASHPDRYDVAILKLDKPVKYTDNVLPVCLPGKDLNFESMVGTVTGFGKTDPSLSNRYGTRLLQKVDVPIIENQECERWHRTRGIDLKIFPEMMCAGYEDGLKDACVGDSGGPLVVKTSSGPGGGSRWTLAGITSAGFGCAQSRQPGIYHRVSHTVDWILDNLD